MNNRPKIIARWYKVLNWAGIDLDIVKYEDNTYEWFNSNSSISYNNMAMTEDNIRTNYTDQSIMWQIAFGAYREPDWTCVAGLAEQKKMPKNNDGRDMCAWCESPTRKCGGFRYDVDYRICTKCGR